jgi:mono/diheme cytochrome c family protein
MAESRKDRRVWWLGGLMAFLLALAPLAVHAEEGHEPQNTMLLAKAMYVKYCSACHGQNGKGDGIVGPFLRPAPTDLTQLAKKNGGKFPFMETLEAIDGTHAVRAHGTSAMPVWGEIFLPNAEAPLREQVEARGKVMLITEYVRSIQAQ